MANELIKMKAAIEDMVDSAKTAARRAERIAADYDGEWEAMSRLSNWMDNIVNYMKNVLPLPPDIEAACQEEEHRWDDYDTPESLGREPR